MTQPYDSDTIDALLRACIEFDGQFHQDFYAGEIAGRGSVPADSLEVKTMLERVSRWDGDLVECLGFGTDSLTYFRLGVAARRIMASGGVGAQVQRRRLARARKVLVPIGISILATVISLLNWLLPQEAAHKGQNVVEARLSALEVARVQQDREVASLRASLDSLQRSRADVPFRRSR